MRHGKDAGSVDAAAPEILLTSVKAIACAIFDLMLVALCYCALANLKTHYLRRIPNGV